MIHLNDQNWDIIIDPENGSLFRRCRFRGHQVFRDFQNAEDFALYQSSHFPLLPFSNRIKNGAFEFEGHKVELPVNAPGQTHAIHGYGWISEWDQISLSSNHCHLRQNQKPNHWPWAYEANQIITVEGNSLRLELSITNKSETPMPAGLGFHPYFADLKNAYLTFKSAGYWQADSDVLPTSLCSITPEFDLSKSKPLRDFDLDHCYIGVNQAEITWDNSPVKINIVSSKNMNRAAVYTAHDQNAFCFEPITHTHNALNAADPVAEGVHILAPFKTLAVWSEFIVY